MLRIIALANAPVFSKLSTSQFQMFALTCYGFVGPVWHRGGDWIGPRHFKVWSSCTLRRWNAPSLALKIQDRPRLIVAREVKKQSSSFMTCCTIPFKPLEPSIGTAWATSLCAYRCFVICPNVQILLRWQQGEINTKSQKVTNLEFIFPVRYVEDNCIS